MIAAQQYVIAYRAKPQLTASIMEETAEHVEMETNFYGNPNTLIITNSTQDWYAETFVDVRAAKQYDSRDHARGAY